MDTMNEQKSLEAATGTTATPGGGPASRREQAPGAHRAPEMRAALPDDVTVSAEIAALYLCMPPAELAEAEKQKQKRTDGRASVGAPAVGRVDKGAKGQTLPTTYTLGAVRELGKKQAASSGLDAAWKAGMLGWMGAKLPFFAELEPRVKRGRRVLIGSAWDVADPEREARFADLVAGRIRCAWITSSEAAASLWSDEASHRAFAARGLAVLEGEVRAIEAAISATASLGAATSTA